MTQITKDIIEANQVFDEHFNKMLADLKPEMIRILGEEKSVKLVMRKLQAHCYQIMFALGWDEEEIFNELEFMAGLVQESYEQEKKATRQ